MTRAVLDEWHAKQSAPADPVGPFDRDASSIRAVLFSDAGRRVLGDRWNAFDWPATPQPYSLVDRDLLIKTPDGRQSVREVVFASPEGMRLIFVGPDDRRNLRAILENIGGTATREPDPLQDEPDQRVSRPVSIARMWGTLFDVRPGHSGGWVLTTYPGISKIEFDREDHALAHVIVGYSGCVVEFEKSGGAWVAKRIVSIWVT